MDFLTPRRKTRTSHTVQSLTVLEQYLYVMHISSYDANERRLQWMKKNDASLGKGLSRATSFLFSSLKLFSSTTFPMPPNHASSAEHKPHMPMPFHIISLGKKTQSTAVRILTVSPTQGPLHTFVVVPLCLLMAFCTITRLTSMKWGKTRKCKSSLMPKVSTPSLPVSSLLRSMLQRPPTLV